MAGSRDRLVVKGYTELVRASDHAGKQAKKEVRDALRRSGEIVRADAAQRFSQYSAKSAAGFTVSVRQTGVQVRQRLRKTTGKHPDFGALQMKKALLPARAAKTEAVEREFERALDHVIETFER